MSDTNINVKIAGDASGLTGAIEEATEALKAMRDAAEAALRAVTTSLADAAAARAAYSASTAADGAREQTERSRQLDEWWRSYSEAMRQQISAAAGNTAAQIQLAGEWVRTADALYDQDTAKKKAALDEQTRLVKAAAAEQQRMSMMWTNEQSKLTQQSGQEEIESLDAEVARGKISADEKYAIQKQLYDRIFQLRLQNLQDEMASYAAGSKGALEAYDHILDLYQQHQNQMAAIDRKQALEEAQTSKQLASTIAGDLMQVLTRRESVKQAAIHLVEQQVQKELELGLQSVIRAISGETQKTAAATAGSTTRTAVSQTENAGFFQRVGQQAAEWLGLETGKTAETTAGSGTRVAANAAETAEAVLLAMGEIEIAAAVAAANAYAAYAGLPPVAAAMAAAAWATTMGFASGLGGGIASAAGGYDIPAGLNPITQLHEREMVLPAEHADTIRALAANANNPMAGLAYAGLGSGAPFGGAGVPSAQEMIRNVMSTSNFGGDTTINQHITHANPARPTSLEDQINGLHRQGAKGVARAVRRLAR